MPYFSIIMPVFNGEKYVRKAIASVRNQSFSNFELIIIDDGSKDNSSEICLAECQTDSRIKFITQNNRGALLARKTGVQTADGIYTLFLDCDDTFQLDSLNLIYRELQNHPVDLLIFNYNKVSAEEKIKPGKQILSSQKIYTGRELVKLSVDYFGELNSLCTKVVKTKFVKNAFALYDCRLSMAEDYLISLQIFKNINNAAYFDKCLYNYTDNPCSSMHNVKKEFFSEYEFVYLNALNILHDFSSLTEEEIKLAKNIMIKIFADYFFYTFQKRLSFQEFWKLGEQISTKKYMHNYTSDLKLGPIWKPIYILMKRHKYKCLYFYFLLLQLGYFIKHGKFST